MINTRPDVSSSRSPEAWKRASILVAAAMASFSEDEAILFFDMVRRSTNSELLNVMATYPKANQIAVAVVRMTQYSGLPGVQEASDVVALASRYMDSGEVMPPELCKVEPAFWVGILDAVGLAEAPDAIQDMFNKITTRNAIGYSVDEPADIIDHPMAAQYSQSLFIGLSHPIRVYQTPSKTGTGDGGATPPAEDTGIIANTLGKLPIVGGFFK